MLDNNLGKTPRQRIKSKTQVIAAASSEDDHIIISEPILKQLGKIADTLGIELYIVGGFVRDYYLKKPRKDLDFTVVGDAVEFAEEIARRFKTKAIVFPKYRTAMVPLGKYQLEFVGTRKEEYKPDSRNPIVTEGTLYDDLKRRDFTINAIAVSLNANDFGKVIDIFDGSRDLRSKLLKTPYDPGTTFNDDPLRMLRAARFATQLGFTIQQTCYFSIKRLAERMTIISQERITEEFMKILSSPRPSLGLHILWDTGLLQYVFPEINNLSGIETIETEHRTFSHKDVMIHTFLVVDNIAQHSDNVWLRFAALLHDVAKPRTKRFNEQTGFSFHGHEEIGARMVERIFRRMKLPMDKVKYVETLVRLHQRPMVLVEEGVTDSAVRRLAFLAGDALEDLFTLCKSDITTNNPKLSFQYLNNYEVVFRKVMDVQEKDRLREFQSPLRGDEIMEICEIKPSKAVGVLKEKIEEAILDNLIANDYDEAKAYFIKHKDEWLNEIKKSGLLEEPSDIIEATE